MPRQQQLTQPLLPTDAPPLPKRTDSQLTPSDGWGGCACLAGPLGSVGIRTSAEARHVSWLALQAFFANGVFVFGRNVGPALFMREVSADGLTSVMFVSGLLVLVCTPAYSRYSVGKEASRVNLNLCLFVLLLLALLVTPLAFADACRGVPHLLPAAACLLFLAEDLLTMMLMMQSASLAQATLTAYDGKRLLGLIQLGSSMGAMVSGLSAGPAASAIGPERLVFVQCALLLLSLLPNGPIWRRERQMAARGKPKSGAGNSSSAQVADGKREENDAPWYRDPLILSMAFWTFAIIFCKTTFEYQYNVLVAGTVSLNEMVTLTGQLYAAAGLLSSLINIFGTNSLMRHLGMMPLLLSSPVFLFCSAVFSLFNPSITAAFVGRMLDLTLRWSLNNTSKSMLWIAMPLRTQQRAKPWVEGTVKKTATSVTAATIAIVIPLAELLGVPMAAAVSCLAAAVALVCCGICFRMHRLYYDAM